MSSKWMSKAHANVPMNFQELEVKALLERIGRNGGYIASPAHDVPRDAKPENVAAMIEVLQRQ